MGPRKVFCMVEAGSERLKTDGTPLTDAEVKRGLRTNIIAGCLANIWANIAGGMPLTMLMNAIGASGVMIGMTATVGQLAMVLRFFSAPIADRTARP